MKTTFLQVSGLLLFAYFFSGCRGIGPAATAVLPTAVSLEQPSATPTPEASRTEWLAEPTSQPVREEPATAEPTTTPSSTPTPTATPTATPRPTRTPTATPPVIAEGLPTPPTAVPTAVPAIPVPDGVTNILLLGNDSRWPQGGRTDSMIILSINEETQTAALLSLPRDLYVYIPGWTMNRLNLALPHGHGVQYGNQGSVPATPVGGGILVKETILYNFGLEIDYYVRVGFETFQQSVELLGGIEVVVNCPLTDWRLITADLDPEVEENWETFTLETGVQEMDGDLALWYARSRRTTNDFDRSRRQQQLLRAMLAQGLALDLLPRVPALWESFQEGVETDMPLNEIVRFAALAPAVRENGIQHLAFPEAAIRAWRVPGTGEAVQLLYWPEAEKFMQQLVQPPLLNRATRPPIVVEVVTDNWIWYRQTAENLEWFGFTPTFTRAVDAPSSPTYISYYGANFKGSFDWLLGWIFNRDAEQIELVTELPDSDIQYRVVLGYDFNPCRPFREAPLGPPL
jgi:LCP family protein required for cell wall assembly